MLFVVMEEFSNVTSVPARGTTTTRVGPSTTTQQGVVRNVTETRW